VFCRFHSFVIASIAGFAISGKFSAAEIILAIAVGFFEANCSTSSVSLSYRIIRTFH
jgi:hypothetical protein